MYQYVSIYYYLNFLFQKFHQESNALFPLNLMPTRWFYRTRNLPAFKSSYVRNSQKGTLPSKLFDFNLKSKFAEPICNISLITRRGNIIGATLSVRFFAPAIVAPSASPSNGLKWTEMDSFCSCQIQILIF